MTQNSWNNQIISATVTFTGGAFNIETNASSYPISIGTGNAAKNMTIGNTTGSSAVHVLAGSGNMVFSTVNGTIDLKTGNSAINVGTDAAAKTITIGNTTEATSFILNAGSEASSFTSNNGSFAIETGLGYISIGTDAAAKKITIGNTTSSTGLALKQELFSLVSASGTVVAASTSAITMPLQPAFLAYLSASVTNVTGDGTSYSIAYNAEYFDQGENFTPAGTFGYFTAPVTGKYRFSAGISTYNYASDNATVSFFLFTTKRNYTSLALNPVNAATSNGTLWLNGSFFCDMNATDIAYMCLQSRGTTKGVSVCGYNGSTYFSGELVC